MKPSHFITLSIISLLVFSGCHSSKRSLRSGEPLPENATLTQRYDALVDGYGNWSDVTVPVSFVLSSPQRFSISGRAKMIHDESIDISLRMLGFEVGRIYLTVDSVHVMVKPKKVYMSESLAEVSRVFKFSVGNVQDLIMGRPFVLGGSTLSPDTRNLALRFIEGDAWSIMLAPSISSASYGYRVCADNFLEYLVAGYNNGYLTASCGYSAPVNVDGVGVVSPDVDINVVNPKQKIEASITWKWDNARWNEGIESEWTVPRGYKRIKAADVIKNVSQD